MSDLTSIFSDIANSLRSKLETEDTFTPMEMPDAIDSIETGYNYAEMVSGNLTYNFAAGVKYSATALNSTATTPKVPATTNFASYQMVYIGPNVVNLNNSFNNCQNLNKPVVINSPKLTNMEKTFNNCRNFNNPIYILNTPLLTKMIGTFTNCVNFNQPVVIPDSVINVSSMFQGATSFNQPITIPNSVTNAAYMFINAIGFNQPINIPDSVNDVSGMFQIATLFNQPINIPDSVTNTSYMFRDATSFNQPITIPNSVTDVSYMFDGAINFKEYIRVCNGEQISSVTKMLNGLTNVNVYCENYSTILNTSIVGVGEFTEVATDVFTNSENDVTVYYNTYVYFNDDDVTRTMTVTQDSSFNKHVILFNGVTNTANMFNGATSFNQPVTIPNSVTNVSFMFQRATSFNQPITIPNSVTDVRYMFARQFNNNVYVLHTENDTINYVGLISGRNLSTDNPRVNVFYNSSLHLENITESTEKRSGTSDTYYYMTSICGNKLIKKTIRTGTTTYTTTYYNDDKISFTEMLDGNGYYNEAYNVYLYNNL